MAQRFEFVTFTSPEDERIASNRQLVRSQALRYYHRQRMNHSKKPNEVELDISHLLESGSEAPGRIPAPEDEFPVDDLNPILIRHSNLAEIDPFFQYPINMGVRDHALYHHRKSNGSAHS
jgi:hypothetical protein